MPMRRNHGYDVGNLFFVNGFTVFAQALFPVLLHDVELGAEFLFLVAIAGRELEVLELYGFVLARLHVVDELFLLFDFLRGGYISKVYA